ncbi:hypothetical protein WFZ85_14900 [Flavobacterium sp. j3]|uniref:Uncharacterized protein n=1 Tax=Flavobacterium aureirubrum TaxID=3133147 RepID=A0ABU9N878_9FLAO
MFLSFGLMIGCSEFEETTDGNSESSGNSLAMRLNENDKPDVQTKIILGKKIDNPYTVSNMQNAFNYYNNVVPNSIFQGREVIATHYYIKILPDSQEQLLILDNFDKLNDTDAPVLHDFPLDHEIIQEGDYYHMPANENDVFVPIYTVVPIDYRMPKELKFEIIDKLYYPTDDEFDVETVSLFFSNWQEDLLADEIVLTLETLPTYLNSEEDSDGPQNRRRRKFTPQGKVVVENSDDSNNSTKWQPLNQAKISVGRGIWWHYVYTNNSGDFVANKSYRGKVRIRSKWRSYTATIRKSWNEVLGIQVSDHLMTLTRGNNNATKFIGYSNNGHLWLKGSIHIGLRKYIEFCNINGIDKTVSDANVWANEGSASSNPMLYKYPQLNTLASVANLTQGALWQSMLTHFVYVGIGILPSHLRPDQIYGLSTKLNASNNQSTIRIHQTVFHESGHYSHALKAGSWLWANVFASELKNNLFNGGPYANGVLPTNNAGARIGLAEGWAAFTEFKITDYFYKRSYVRATGIGEGFRTTAELNTILENFNVVDRPMNIDRTDNWSWWLHGIYWDLLDNGRDKNANRLNGNGNPLNLITDVVNISVGNNQYNLSPIFNRLTSGVHNVSDFKSAVLSSNTAQSAQINQLFTSYGY